MKSKNKILLLNVIFLVLYAKSFGQVVSKTNYKSISNEEQLILIPDTATAIKIAETIWLPLYGKDIYKEIPFRAKLINDSIWKVRSTNKYRTGGEYIIKINKKTCFVYYVNREK
ncbi:MAG: NTF2 fold immunity protein [Bacteroidota bacterium]|nr:NTF2 fold immunity protein [Bacteroidota bacterium]